jgi:hypothetical protein
MGSIEGEEDEEEEKDEEDEEEEERVVGGRGEGSGTGMGERSQSKSTSMSSVVKEGTIMRSKFRSGVISVVSFDVSCSMENRRPEVHRRKASAEVPTMRAMHFSTCLWSSSLQEEEVRRSSTSVKPSWTHSGVGRCEGSGWVEEGVNPSYSKSNTTSNVSIDKSNRHSK